MSYDEPDPYPLGLACDLCGDVATSLIQLQGFEVKQGLCDSCRHDQITDCPECGSWFLQSQGTRIEGNSLHCPACASRHTVVVGDVMAGIKADEAQDDFQQRRR